MTITGSMSLAEQVKLIQRVTRAVRKADVDFERVGGSSRHWVVECFLPELENEGLLVVDRQELAELMARIVEPLPAKVTDEDRATEHDG